ncbi:5-formyltetrahydrofolate cyclo-ligase [Thalassobacter stenotrophicus]|uniref:5-formyltetrahydrofolate cyclo-ligase n=1 Tax=Thalassobacter stenotrophicus TaxID=266809 RepID=UPI0022A9DD0B|nr:5-formyltetrahydrofolate cyclo-ligase [Thalassobacter stenotrophicus]UYP68760.1 5-formyltetrahydrofolate cyclo-ligase [Thalassobacter stenotrophicus]
MTSQQPAKAELRSATMAKRAEDHGKGYDAAAVTRLLEWIGPVKGAVIAGYMPIRTEISPLSAMSALSRDNTVCVPVVQGAGLPLVFHRWSPEAEMMPGAFGASVPKSAEVVTPDIVIVPLVAFDLSRGRLGYGGGFYDRTLEKLRAVNAKLRVVGFAYDAQQVSHVPLEPTDQPLDALITPTRCL